VRRADRLLQIVQILRRRRKPTSAKLIAEELGVVPRTIYRDIVDLQASHVPIDGEPGVGYVLRKGYNLPPLMFDQQELEVIVLGARMVSDRGDAALTKASEDVIAKVLAVIPDRISDDVWRAELLMPHRAKNADASGAHLADVRKAVRESNKLCIDYFDGGNHQSSRVVWPLGVYFYSHVTIVCAWCELRNDFRAFRTDRISGCRMTNDKFDPQNGDLFKKFMRNWLAHETEVKSGYETSIA
jgi:predicted DNA-binding transcriptional regulator YafY